MTILNIAPNQELLNPQLRDVVAYRKSGLSLNHIIGCPLDCAYCVRHFFDNFETKVPQALCTNEEAVQQLIDHPFFTPNITPVQIFNRATDPLVTTVKPYTHDLLKQLDIKGLRNSILLITRAKVTQADVESLERLKNLRITLLITYSGIVDERIEPISKSGTTIASIQTISKFKEKVKLVLYWRPIVAGWNDDQKSFERVFDVASLSDAIVYTGYYHRPENHEYLKSLGINLEYPDFARRKVLPQTLEKRILKAYKQSGLKIPLFRKTSCGVTYAHNLPDYNGHWGVNELCDICPQQQRELCEREYRTPKAKDFQELLDLYGYETPFLIEKGHIWTEGLGEEKRYHLQHTLGFQIWDIDKPHFRDRHGRSPFGHRKNDEDSFWYESLRKKFFQEVKEADD